MPVAQTGVYGPLLSPTEQTGLVARLRHGDDPGGPDVPWAVAVCSADGTVRATCSTMLSSGLFWASTPAGPIIGLDPLSVACAVGPVRLDAGYVSAYSRSAVTAHSTPFRGVARIPAGRTARWLPGATVPVIVDWVGPVLNRPPDLSGPRAVTTYVDTFDRVVADLVARQGQTVVALSGGLDSTFVMSAMRRTSCRVTALTHRPLPAAAMDTFDEFEQAGLMCPDRHVSVYKRQSPLAAAASAWQRSGIPVFAPDNQIWISAFDEMAPGGWWTGGHGNAAFSHHHAYAAGWGWPGRRRAGRRTYLRWLLRSNSPLAAAANPAAGPVRIDPFCAREVLAVAARIRPAEWRRGGARGFARRAGVGRVPAAIRLNHHRGQQSADAWFVIRHDRDEYLQRAEVVDQVRGLEYIDGKALIDQLSAWPWGEPKGPALSEVFAVNRLLALADFARGIERARGVGTLLEDPARVAPDSAPLSTNPSRFLHALSEPGEDHGRSTFGRAEA